MISGIMLFEEDPGLNNLLHPNFYKDRFHEAENDDFSRKFDEELELLLDDIDFLYMSDEWIAGSEPINQYTYYSANRVYMDDFSGGGQPGVYPQGCSLAQHFDKTMFQRLVHDGEDTYFLQLFRDGYITQPKNSFMPPVSSEGLKISKSVASLLIAKISDDYTAATEYRLIPGEEDDQMEMVSYFNEKITVMSLDDFDMRFDFRSFALYSLAEVRSHLVQDTSID